MPNLSGYRRHLLAQVGGGGVYTTTAAGDPDGSTLVCLTFRAPTPTVPPGTPLPAPELDADHLGYAWVYVPSTTAPRQRRVRKDGLDVETGTISVADVFGGPIPTGVEFEMSSKLAPINDGSRDLGLALNDAINLALLRLLVPFRAPYVTQEGSAVIDLSAYDWADRPERVVGLYEPARTAARAGEKTRRDWEFRANGSAAQIVVRPGFNRSGQTGEVDLLRPAATLINGADSTGGLVADADEAVPDANSVTTVALYYVYLQLANDPNGGETYRALADQQLARCRQLNDWDTTADRLPQAPPTAAPPAAAATVAASVDR